MKVVQNAIPENPIPKGLHIVAKPMGPMCNLNCE
jgi:hypothetical protein